MQTIYKYAVGLIMSLLATTSLAYQITGSSKITEIDSLNSNLFWVSLEGYSNASCDQNRILLDKDSLGADYYEELIALLLSAFYAEKSVQLAVSDSCRADRVIIRK